MKLIAILLVLTFSSAQANEVSYLDKGAPAPYSGYLFSPSKEKQIRLKVEELEFCDKSKALLENLSKDYEERHELVLSRLKARDEQIESLNEQLAKKDSMLSKIGFFILGAVITGGIAYGVSRTVR